jgi:hypothetical protein
MILARTVRKADKSQTVPGLGSPNERGNAIKFIADRTRAKIASDPITVISRGNPSTCYTTSVWVARNRADIPRSSSRICAPDIAAAILSEAPRRRPGRSDSWATQQFGEVELRRGYVCSRLEITVRGHQVLICRRRRKIRVNARPKNQISAPSPEIPALMPVAMTLLHTGSCHNRFNATAILETGAPLLLQSSR